MSPKYENRRTEFFATFLEFLRNYIRDKYYEFMNDIQTEVNFFEWFDHYFKPKILVSRNNNSLLYKETMHTSQKTNTDNSLLQKEVIKNSTLQKKTTYNSLLPSSTDNISLATKQSFLTSQNTKISNTTPPNIPPLTKIHASNIIDFSHACSTSHNSLLYLTSDNIHLATNQQNNIHIATREPFLTRQNAQINTIKKNKKYKDKKKAKEREER